MNMNITWMPMTEKETAELSKTVRSEAEKNRKAKIVIPEGAEVVLPILAASPGFTIIEIHQMRSSKVKFIYLQNAQASLNTHIIIRIILENGAHMDSLIAMIGGSESSVRIETMLLGNESSVHERTLYFGGGDQIFDMFSETALVGRNCKAEIESKGILTDRAKARFDGKIHIKQTAHGGDAKLVEHTLLLSSDAKMNAIPGLTIDTNDVAATHSASMTRVDDEQLFFAESRGIDERDAIRMIAEGFLKNLIPEETLEIDSLIQEKICRL